MEAGEQHTFNLGLPYDFESNQVFFEFAEIRSEDLIIDPDWLTVTNATLFEDVRIKVNLPEDVADATLELIITIGDNHKREPLERQYTVQIAVKGAEKSDISE